MSRRFSVRAAFVIGLWIACLSTIAWGQDSVNPDASLGDVARQTRTEKHAKEGQTSKAQALADEMQQDQEVSEAAPTGFKTYDAGAYRLFVPFPYSLEGRENDGAVLLGSRLGATNTEVMAGAPIPIPANVSDGEMLFRVRQLAGMHGQSASCSQTKLGSHKSFRCSWSGEPYLLGHEVWGTMDFVVASNSLIPVMCVSPDEMQCLGYTSSGYRDCNNRLLSWDQVQKTNADIDTRFRDEKTTAQVCDQIIYPSIQLKEDMVVHPATIPEEEPAKTSTGTIAPDTTGAVSEGQSESLGELARRTRQASHGAAQARLDNSEGTSMAPAGFQAFSVQFCLHPQSCGEASVAIPEEAEVVSRVNGQYIFKTVLNGSTVVLYAGPADVNAPYRSMTDPDYIRMRDLANPNGWSREKTDGVSTQELTIEGLPALMTRFRYQRDQKTWWIGERTLIDGDSSQFLLACTAPEEHFADAEALCTTLVNSLRFP